MAKDLNNQETTGGLVGGMIGVIMLFALIFWADFGVWGSLLTSVFTGAIIVAMIDAPRAQQKKNKNTKEDFDLKGFGATIWESKEGEHINFTYTDASGKKTERKIILHKIMKDSRTRFYFEGYCKMRKASRTFCTDKIKNLHNEQGEVIELPDFINTTVGYGAFGSSEVRTIEEK